MRMRRGAMLWAGGIAVAAVGGWGAYWAIGSEEMRDRVTLELERAARAGLVIEHGPVESTGTFGLSWRKRLPDLTVRHAASGLSAALPELVLEADPLSPDGVVARFPPAFTVTLAAGRGRAGGDGGGGGRGPHAAPRRDAGGRGRRGGAARPAGQAGGGEPAPRLRRSQRRSQRGAGAGGAGGGGGVARPGAGRRDAAARHPRACRSPRHAGPPRRGRRPDGWRTGGTAETAGSAEAVLDDVLLTLRGDARDGSSASSPPPPPAPAPGSRCRRARAASPWPTPRRRRRAGRRRGAS